MRLISGRYNPENSFRAAERKLVVDMRFMAFKAAEREKCVKEVPKSKRPAVCGKALPRGKRVLLAVLMGLWCSLTGCSGETGSADVPELLEPVGAVRDTAVVKREDCYKLEVFSGQVIPGYQEAAFPQDGTVTEILVHMGDSVKKGQVLVRLDESGLEEQMKSLEKQVSQKQQENSLLDTIAQKQEQQLELELETLKKEGNTQAAAEKSMELDTLKLQNRQNEETRALALEELEEELDDVRSAFGQAEVTAPCDGVIQYMDEAVKVGAAAKKDTLVAYISDESQVMVLCPELGVSEAQNAEKIVGNDGEKEYTLTPVPYTTEETVSMVLAGSKIMARFSADDLPPCGAYMTISVIGVMKEDVITIPVNAYYKDSSGTYVYCIREDGGQERRDIEIGLITETTVEVTEGLQEGETIYVKN